MTGWLVLWHILALAVDNKILLATPLETARELVSLLCSASFYLTVSRSLLRIGIGFAAGFVAAVLLAFGSWRFPWAEEVMAPVMTLLKAVPVASFAVLLLIWWGSSFLAVAVCFMVVLPNLYINLLEGMKSMDRGMLELAQVFRLPLWNRFFYIFRPALRPFLYSGLKLSLGMCWKSGVAAEVIGTPDFSIGERLYLSKVYLDTAGIFAWTGVVIGLSILFEKAVLLLLQRFLAWEPACRKPRGAKEAVRENTEGEWEQEQMLTGGKGTVGGNVSIRLVEVTKSYNGRTVIDRLSTVYESGEIYYLTGPSGSGKTTLLHILARLVMPDSGQVTVPSRCSMAFQEDRICDDYSAVKNVELVTGDRKGAQEALGLLLEQEALDKPCRQLSGGMRRRVAIVRAMEADSACVFLDEPFSGMDPRTRERARRYIRERQGGRTLIIADHFRDF